MTELLKCVPRLGEWCCEDLRQQVCDDGETCGCRLVDQASPDLPCQDLRRGLECGRPYFLTDDGLVLKSQDGDFLDECPYCAAPVSQGEV